MSSPQARNAGDAAAFRILGPLQVWHGDSRLPLGGHRQVTLLAFMLVHAGQAMSSEGIVGDLWPGQDPRRSINSLKTAVGRLRKALEPLDHGDHESPVRTTGKGYRLELEPHELDAHVFEATLLDGGAALKNGDPALAAQLLRRAEALWRGPALADVAYETFAQAEIRRLEELRMTAIETRVDAELQLGRHAALASELEALVARHPTRERLAGQLMLARYRCGRQADALDAYQRTRVYLSSELGLEPGRGLQALQQRILSQDVALELTAEDRHEPTDATRAAGGRSNSAADHPAPKAHDPFPLPAVTRRASEGMFVGRERCLECLGTHWSASLGARMNLVLLEGEPGIGKTRLATQFAEEVQRDGAAVLYGRVDEEPLLPYQPFAEALDHLIAHAGPGFAAEVEGELGILGRLFPSLGVRATPDLASADEDSVRYLAFEALAAVLRRASAHRPLLLVLDDLHWADKSTLLLLRHVLRRSLDARLLVVGTSRLLSDKHQLTDFLADLRRDLRYERLSVGGFDEQQTHALVVDHLGVDVTPGFIHELQGNTGGNAFFIEETARALKASGAVWQGVVDEGALATAGVPSSVREVISHRVKQLGEQAPLAPDCLTAASVIGPTFDVGLVEELVDADADDVLAAIDLSMTAGLVSEVPGRVGVYTFAHAHVRDVLDRQLSRMRRVDLHHRAALALEALDQGMQVNPAELAHHFALAQEQAGSGPARRYAIAAGRRAAEVFAYDEALVHFRRALELFDDPADETERCDVLLAIGRVQWHVGDEDVKATFREAVESARRRGDAGQLAEAALGLGERFFEVTYAGNQYRQLLETALAAVGPGDSRRRVLLLSRLATNLAFPHEHPDAHTYAEEAIQIARRREDDTLLVPALLARHVTLLDVAHLERRLEVSDELASLSGRHQELTAERHYARMYDRLGIGDLDTARREAAGLEALAARLNQPLLLSLAFGTRGMWAELDGDMELAERCAQDFRAQATRAKTEDAISSWASQVFPLRRRAGGAGFLALKPYVEGLVEAGGDQIGWRSALGVLYFETGDVDGARCCYEEELRAWSAGLPRGMFWLTRVAMLSEMCAMFADERRAGELHTALADYAGRNVVVAYCSFLGPVDTYLALLAETFGDDELAAIHARAAMAQVRTLNAPLLARDLENRHGAVIAQ